MLEVLKNPFILWAMVLTIVVILDVYMDADVYAKVQQMSSLDEVIQKLQLSGNLCPDIKN